MLLPLALLALAPLVKGIFDGNSETSSREDDHGYTPDLTFGGSDHDDAPGGSHQTSLSDFGE
jgi:hypothetical protein